MTQRPITMPSHPQPRPVTDKVEVMGHARVPQPPKALPLSTSAEHQPPRLRAWLRTLILAAPPSRRCRRWSLLRKLRDELTQ